MKTFTIYPDKARALGNVMTNKSNVEDMVGVNATILPLVDNEHPLIDEFGNEYKLPITENYDNLPFPVFEMRVLGTLYDTSLTLSVSSDNCYVGDTVTITATLRDGNNELLDGSIAFKCGNDFITNGNNTGQESVYANTTNGVVSFTYSFDSMGEYTISAYSLQTNMHHCSTDSLNITVSKKPITIAVNGINSTTTYVEDIPFTVELSSNNQAVTGLEYSISLDGETFDSGTSTANGESYILSNLDIGNHTLLVYYPGNNLYDSCSESIEFYDGKIPEIFITYSNSTLVVEVYSETVPVVGIPVNTTISINPPLTFSNYETDSSGKVSCPLNGLPSGNYTVTVTTSAYGDLSASEKSSSIIIS
ncbi:Ig-like domain-containing protein [Methanobrevibacter sp.]|uniref:Ig-like domain-containing protein n=1 Tax=Methanobrevibacter sp. TaxID=66852 RepID=UPI00386A24C4